MYIRVHYSLLRVHGFEKGSEERRAFSVGSPEPLKTCVVDFILSNEKELLKMKVLSRCRIVVLLVP